MKIKLFIFLSLISLISLTGCNTMLSPLVKGEYFNYESTSYFQNFGDRLNDEEYNYDIKIKAPKEKLRNDFACGVDISTIEMVEECGGVFYNEEGKEQNVYEILRENGVNFVRLRLWNDPFNKEGKSYGAGNNDILTDLKIMKKAKRVGMNILLDFHYSDFWADPGSQTCPKAWVDTKDINKAVYDYTFDALKFYKDNGINIDAVQLGNEINNGLIYPYGKLNFSNYDNSLVNISNILKSAQKASKDVFKNIKTIVHLANAHDKNPFVRYLRALEKNNVDYDIIGVSAYPYWHGNKDNLYKNLNYVSTIFNKPVMIVETSYGYTFETNENVENIFDKEKAKVSNYEVSPQGQVDLLCDEIDVLSRINNNMGLGIFYWEPCWLPVKNANAGNSYGLAYQMGSDDISKFEEWKNGWANQCLFSYTGKMLPSLKVFSEIQKNN